MSNPAGRQRGGWWLGLGVAGLAVCGLLGLYFWWAQPTYTPDPQLIAEFGTASLLTEPPPPDTWPQWRGPRRDGVSGATGLRTDWPEEGLPVLWRVPLGGGQSSPAVADGRLITMTQDGDNEVVVCVDAETGKDVWRFPYAAKFFIANQVSGPSSTPCIVGDRVFTVGATGLMHALDVKTGKKLWARDLLKDFGATNLRWSTTFSPLVDGDRVFVNPGGAKGSVAALNAASGETVWKGLDGEPAGYSSPILATVGGVKQVVFFTGRSLSGLKAEDGSLLWKFPWPTMHEVNAATPLWLRAKQGADHELDYFFISSGYGKGCALVKVAMEGGEFKVGLAYSGTQLKTHFSSNVRVGDEIYGFDDPGMLTCLEARTGQVRWRERGPEDNFGRGSLLVADGHLLALSERGWLVLVEPSPEGYRPKASWRALDAKCWSAPALVGRRLYVRSETELLCLDVGKK